MAQIVVTVREKVWSSNYSFYNVHMLHIWTEYACITLENKDINSFRTLRTAKYKLTKHASETVDKNSTI